MKRLIAILSVVVVWPLVASWAQVLPPNEAGVSMGHVHLYVRDVEAAKKLWTSLGGTPVKVDGTDVMKFPGTLVFLSSGSPSGGNEKAVVHHIAFYVVNGRDRMAQWKEAGLRVEKGDDPNRPDNGSVYSPENMRVEVIGRNSQTAPIELAHLHYFLSAANAEEAKAWYAKVLGAKPAQEFRNDRAVPGVNLRIAVFQDPGSPLPTKGQTLDHIGFEVTNLEAFCKKLAASGVKFDEPYSKMRHASFASARFTDPWGVSIELTEGLNRF